MNPRSSTPSRVIRMLYALCLAGATYNHAVMNLEHGLFWDYGGAPWPTSAFWTSLTFLDPLAVLLLFLAPRKGVALTAAIIVSDVVHNIWFGYRFGIPVNAALIAQMTFLVFVLATVRTAWDIRPRATTRAQHAE